MPGIIGSRAGKAIISAGTRIKRAIKIPSAPMRRLARKVAKASM